MVFFLINSVGCSTMSKANDKLEPLKPISRKVDLQRFMGKWYVIAAIPTFAEKGAHNAVENYSWNEEEQRIDVLYTQRTGSFEGKTKEIPQKAFVHNTETNAEWRIQIFWFVKLPYLIVDLAEDYSYTIIGVPNRNYVWIMSRNPQMDEAVYQSLVAKIQGMGFDIKELIKTPQKW